MNRGMFHRFVNIAFCKKSKNYFRSIMERIKKRKKAFINPHNKILDLFSFYVSTISIIFMRKRLFTNIYSADKKNSKLSLQIIDNIFWFLCSVFSFFKEKILRNKKPEIKNLELIKNKFLTKEVSIDEPTVFWVGHSSFIIRINGINIITDPVWSNNVGIHFISLKRIGKPPIDIDSIGTPSILLISHNHCDHFDMSTVSKLHSINNDVKIFVAEGMRSYLPGKFNVTEMPWGKVKSLTINKTKIEIVSVPSLHSSQTSLFDKDCSHWCGWVIRIFWNNRIKTFYYPGDTAFSTKMFKEIGKIFGPFDLSIIPVGAYYPSSLLSESHLSPLQAMKMHKLVKSKFSIGCHHSTFRLSNHLVESRNFLHDFNSAIKSVNVAKDEFILVPMGKYINW